MDGHREKGFPDPKAVKQHRGDVEEDGEGEFAPRELRPGTLPDGDL